MALALALALGSWSLAGCRPRNGDDACRSGPPAVWERLDLPGPAARLDAALAADEGRKKVFLFGGRGPEGFHDDLWVLDLALPAWQRLEGGGPPARSGASLVVVPGSGKLLLFGGYRTDTGGRIQLLNDLWSRSADGGWTREYVPGPPSPRAWHSALAIDERMLVFGGFTRAAGSAGAYLQDVWALELTEPAWRRAATDGGPRMAGRAALGWREAEQQLEVFGRNGIPIPETIGFWRLDVSADRWSAPELKVGQPLDFGALGTLARDGRVVALRGPDFHEPAWGVWSAAPGRDCRRHEATGGPVGGEGLVCAAEPGRPGAWLCFGGALEKTVSDATWRLRLPADEAGP